MQKILKTFLKRLTNLSANNRTLVLLRPTLDHFVDIHDFDFLLKQSSFSLIEGLIEQKKSIPLCAEMDSRDESVNKMSKRLKRLARVDKFIYEERGSKDLYVGWPFAWGTFADGGMVRCPLVFFPVELELKNSQWNMVLRDDVNITLNKTFLLAYAHYNDVKIDDDLLEWVFDDAATSDSRIFRTALYKLFKDSPVEINFNQENFVDKLISFKTFKKDEFLDQTGQGQLKLYPEAMLGIFPQSGSHLVPDYSTLLKEKEIPDLEDFFISKRIDNPEIAEGNGIRLSNYLHRVKEEQTYTPYKIDGYQENALKAVKRGNSVVIQGPPGTGKSQLICNLISDYLANNKTVLLVSQKRAALDVVYERLDKNEFSDFVALIHDFKNDRKFIYKKIADQIENIYEYKGKNSTLDAIELERKFLALSRNIDRISEELEEYKFALFDKSEAGVAVKELYLTSDLSKASVNLRQQYSRFKIDEMDDFARRLKVYAQYHSKIESANHPWNNRKSFENHSVQELQEIKKVIAEIPRYQEEIAKAVEPVLRSKISLSTAEEFYKEETKIRELIELIKDNKVFKYFSQIVLHKDKDTDPLWLSNIERIIMDCFKGVGPEISLKAGDLGRFQEALERGMNARKNLFSWFRWKFFGKDKIFISRVIVANGLRNNRAGFDSLVMKIDNRLNLEHYLTKLRETEWLIEIPETLNKADFQTWFHTQKKALKAKLIFTSIRNFKEYFNLPNLEKAKLISDLNTLLEVFKDIPQRRQSWDRYLSNTQISMIIEDPINAERMIASLETDFDSICDFDRIYAELKVWEREVVDKIFEVVDEYEMGAVEIFQNSIRLAWIDHIEAKYPILRTVSSLQQENAISELRDSIEEKKRISKEIVLLKARERTYRNVQYNRLNNPITYRDLQHQVTKKRLIWPVRRLIAGHYEELFDLIPCWMASPESVSAIFPMKELFDLVIFDEASQCFAERGVPAMYRGKQVVVAGDEKQLRPNDLYSVRWQDENEDDIPELEIDSLLQLASRYLEGLQLQGHYRSKRPELIHFSNKHFYDLKLRLLPDFQDINSTESTIEYKKVDGIWDGSKNDAEAFEICRLVEEILGKDEKKEIAIVTFNARQQFHVMESLDQFATKQGFKIPESLIVKNIENVQGDEKDVVIFSVSYAPDVRGNFNMQFGSLNVEGGENRLNVAVTRAREKIYVVSSIFPNQLKVDDTKNRGPKLLKAYLTYAKDISDNSFSYNEAEIKSSEGQAYLKSRIAHIDWEDDLLSFHEELPFADITIKHRDKYAGLLLTDDEIFYSSISIKDPYVYTPLTLSDKNWNFRHFYSRRFWNDPSGEREKMERFLSSIRRQAD